jgi:hypothetical protein
MSENGSEIEFNPNKVIVVSVSKEGRHSYCKGCFNKATNDYKQEEFECPHCELMYCSKDSLGVHLRRKHYEDDGN